MDPSLLHVETVTDWGALLVAVQARLAARAPGVGVGEFVNAKCPIMNNPIDPARVTEDLIRPFKGGKVAFCCAICPPKWDKLNDTQKQRKLDASAQADRPFKSIWNRLSPDLRKALLAVPPEDWPAVPLRHQFTEEINRILTRRDLYDADMWELVKLTSEAKDLLALGVEKLPPDKLTRLNRLLLEAVLPEGLAKGRTGLLFEGRQIVLGLRAGDHYLVRSGLAENERVVTRGNFKIDSAIQLLARPSMMLSEGGPSAGGHHHGGSGQPKAKGAKGTEVKRTESLPTPFKHQMHAVLAAGAKVAPTLSAGKLGEIREAFAALGKAVEAANSKLLTGRFRRAWNSQVLSVAEK